MSTLRVDTLQTPDSLFQVDVKSLSTSSMLAEVATFADLAGLTPANQQWARTQNYLTTGDFGGADYRWNGSQWVLIPSIAGINVKQLGARGDGTDDTSALNAAFAYSGYCQLADGAYKITGPLYAQAQCKIFGNKWEKCRIQRSGVWDGHTLNIGDATTSSLEFEVTEVLFEQLHPGFSGGVDTPIVDRLTNGQAHIKVWGGTGGKIHKCWFQFGVYGVDIVGGNQITVEQCFFNGIYDGAVAGRQESIAGIRVNNSSLPGMGYATCHKLLNNNFSGYFSPDRTINNGANTYVSHQDCGYQYGILINGCEGIEIAGGYIGVNNSNSIKIASNSTLPLLQNVNIHDVFFDGCTLYSILITSEDGGIATIVDIHDNKFNGQLVTYGALQMSAYAGAQSSKLVTFKNNTGNGHNRCPIYNDGCGGFFPSDNKFIGYNARNGGGAAQTNAAFQAGLYSALPAGVVQADDNYFGGAVNDPTAQGFADFTVVFGAGMLYSTASNNRGLMRDGTLGRTSGVTQTYPTS